MTIRAVALAWPSLGGALVGTVAGCGSKNGGPQSATPPAAAPAAHLQPPTSAPVTSEELKQAAAAAQESAGEVTDPGDASLERLAAMPESAQLPGGNWKAGVNIPAGRARAAHRRRAGPGRSAGSVLAGLPALLCARAVHRELEQEQAGLREVRARAVMWGPAHRSHARLFYTLQVLGKRRRPVPKAFDEIHRRGNMLVATGNDAQSQRLQLAFAMANGISEADFTREYNGFAVNTRLQRAEELMRRYRIEGVPFMSSSTASTRPTSAWPAGTEQLIR